MYKILPVAVLLAFVVAACGSAGDGGSNRYVDNGDGTIIDNETGLIWEKKVDAGGADDLHDVTTYPWSGTCSISGADCQPDAGAAATCMAGIDDIAAGCSVCGFDAGTCETSGDTQNRPVADT